jgi:group I intron endonuclease
MPTNKPGIYFIINLENGKVYVGQTNNIKSRIAGHFRDLKRGKHCNRHLQSAFEKYGEEKFRPHIAEFCAIDDLTAREQAWMDYLGEAKIYNIAPAGGSCLGIKHTKEFCEKQSARRKGMKQPLHVCLAVGMSNRTRITSDETRRKLSLALSRRVVTKETRMKLSAANKGRPLSEDQKKKISDARSKKITAFGKTKTLIEWSAETGIPATAIDKRLRYGWSAEDALTKPKRQYGAALTQVEAAGAGLGVQFGVRRMAA